MNQVGGSSINLDPRNISLGKRETVEDAAKNFSRWVDVIVARTFSHKLVEELSTNSTVPVINALTDQFHPCQALAFGQTLREHRGELKGLNLVFVGDGNNVANSLLVIASQLGMNFTLSCPIGYEQSEDLINKTAPLFSKNGGVYKMVRDPHEAVAKADVIYTDVWVSMGEEAHENEKTNRFKGYQVNSDLVAKADKDCLVSHCLPAHRGAEITSEVMDAENCICFDEAENRLHAQKAVLLSLLSSEYSLK